MIEIEKLTEIKLLKDFNLIRETLTRIGLGNVNNKVLSPSCYLLHKQGKYYIVHFKELMMLDGKTTTYDEHDKAIKNYIVRKLSELKYIDLLLKQDNIKYATREEIIFLKYKDKADWNIINKYTIGKDHGTNFNR